MKLLIITQKVDRNDPILGFFHRWIEEFAKYCEKVTVICLEKGEHNLPENVRVWSLGKEIGESRLKYLFNFYKYIWQERKNYDNVFVHMNQEYVLLGGLFWRIQGKNIGLWRNHPAGNLLTGIAVLLCHRVFCTSRYSYTARFKKTEIMPVGIDTNLFRSDFKVEKIPQSILFLARMAPIKRPDLLIKALEILQEKHIRFAANFYGDPLPQDAVYYQALRNHTGEQLLFHPGVPNKTTVNIYTRHQISVNLSPSGMYDKTIFEAAACGCLPLSSNENLRGQIDERLIFGANDPVDLARKLEVLLGFSGAECEKMRRAVRDYVVRQHSLKLLGQKLFHTSHAPF